MTDKKLVVSTRPLGSSAALPDLPSAKKRMKKVDEQHRFIKKTFQQPTWCPFAEKFIWSINKNGYECRVCKLPVSRRFIGAAKQTICGEVDVMDGLSVNAEHATKNRIFTVYLPHGAKKSVLFNPMELLQTVLEKICTARGINMDQFVAEDMNGQVIELNTQLFKIPGSEITFTPKDSEIKEEVTNVRQISNSGGKALKTNSTNKKPDEKGKSPPKKSEKLNVTEIYEFGRELGAGAFSVVRAAKHKDTGQEVAVKILDKYEDDDEQTQKFKSEINIISNLKHESIVEFYELDEDEENFYVVMELVDGGELFDKIIANGPIPEIESACVVAQVLKAIEYMHGIGIAHRDLKPENLLFKGAEAKTIKLADFGESKSFRESTLSTYCGTPDYMAPEIIRGDPYGPAVDIWSIGVITYVMLAGFPPFDGDNDVEVFASILSIKYEFPNPEWNKISQSAKDFIRSIFVTSNQRLTAAECLAHPWILNHVPPELRTNGNSLPNIPADKIPLLKETSAEASDGEEAVFNTKTTTSTTTTMKKKGKKGTGTNTPAGMEDDDPLSPKDPKKQIFETIQTLMKQTSNSPEFLLINSELRVMSQIIDATVGSVDLTTNDPRVELEGTIYRLYWDRLKDLRVLLTKKVGPVSGVRTPMSARTPGSSKKKKEKK